MHFCFTFFLFATLPPPLLQQPPLVWPPLADLRHWGFLAMLIPNLIYIFHSEVYMGHFYQPKNLLVLVCPCQLPVSTFLKPWKTTGGTLEIENFFVEGGLRKGLEWGSKAFLNSLRFFIIKKLKIENVPTDNWQIAATSKFFGKNRQILKISKESAKKSKPPPRVPILPILKFADFLPKNLLVVKTALVPKSPHDSKKPKMTTPPQILKGSRPCQNTFSASLAYF